MKNVILKAENPNKFDPGDRVITTNGITGKVDSVTHTGNQNYVYRVDIDKEFIKDKFVVHQSCEYHEISLRLDTEYYREQKLKDLLDEGQQEI